MPSNRKTIPLFLILFSLQCACVYVPEGETRRSVLAPDYQGYLRDDLFFAADTEPQVEQLDILYLPRAIQDHIDEHIIGLKTEQDRYIALRQWMREHFYDYRYDVAETLRAPDLLSSDKINCLSFSSLFVAAARYANLPANFQLVDTPPYWDNQNNTWVLNQHVNVFGVIKMSVEGKRYAEGFSLLRENELPGFKPAPAPEGYQFKRRLRYVSDLTPGASARRFKSEKLSDQQALSLFYNNKAGEALRLGDLPVAYAYVKAALRADSSLGSVWNTLGVLMQRKGEIHLAESIYHKAIEQDDATSTAKSNLATVYRSLGKVAAAEELEAQLVAYRESNPFYHYKLAEESLEKGDISRAIVHYTQAIDIKDDESMFYHGLAKAQVKLQRYTDVRDSLAKAESYAGGADRNRFANKLSRFDQALAARQAAQ